MVEQWKNELGFLELIGCHQTFPKFENDAMALRPELLVLELSVLRQERIVQLLELVHRSGTRRTVVVYTFGRKNLLEQLSKQGVVTLRSPVTPEILQQVCLADIGNQTTIRAVISEKADQAEAIPPRRFDSETLVAIANVATKIQCECPHHLADLLFRHNAFEAYSADCENRNRQDAILHGRLHRATARARALLEDALEHLIQTEEIVIDRHTN